MEKKCLIIYYTKNKNNNKISLKGNNKNSGD